LDRSGPSRPRVASRRGAAFAREIAPHRNTTLRVDGSVDVVIPRVNVEGDEIRRGSIATSTQLINSTTRAFAPSAFEVLRDGAPER
jgi:hypothetical protein